MKALVGTFNQEKALVGAFSVIVKTDCETDWSSAALVLGGYSGWFLSNLCWYHFITIQHREPRTLTPRCTDCRNWNQDGAAPAQAIKVNWASATFSFSQFGHILHFVWFTIQQNTGWTHSLHTATVQHLPVFRSKKLGLTCGQILFPPAREKKCLFITHQFHTSCHANVKYHPDHEQQIILIHKQYIKLR